MPWVGDAKLSTVVERMLSDPGLCPCDPAILERPQMAATLQLIADDTTRTWVPAADRLADVVNYACSLWGKNITDIETHLNNNRGSIPPRATLGDMVTYLTSPVVLSMVDTAVDEARRVVSDVLPRSRSVLHLWDTVERSNPESWLVLSGVRWDVAKEDVRELLLRPHFIKHFAEVGGIAAMEVDQPQVAPESSQHDLVPLVSGDSCPALTLGDPSCRDAWAELTPQP
jgi:hypothetical protein